MLRNIVAVSSDDAEIKKIKIDTNWQKTINNSTMPYTAPLMREDDDKKTHEF